MLQCSIKIRAGSCVQCNHHLFKSSRRSHVASRSFLINYSSFFSMLTKHRPFQFKVNSSQFVSIQPRKEKKVSVC